MSIKVFKLDDYEWWAGESLQQCIDHARREAGCPISLGKSYPDAEQEGYELSAEDMLTHRFTEEDGVTQRSFADHLASLIAGGETFPRLFAATEW